MLLRKHFRRCHYAGLEAVSDGYKCSQHCDHRFSASDISLQEAVHLRAALHVVADFRDYAFLGACQREREGFVAFVECLADTVHRYAVHIPAPHIFLL